MITCEQFKILVDSGVAHSTSKEDIARCHNHYRNCQTCRDWVQKNAERDRQSMTPQEIAAETIYALNKKGLSRFYGVLLSLGFSSYQEYLSSELWQRIRTRVLVAHRVSPKIPGTECLLCPMDATEVHHSSYSRAVMEGRDLTKLIPLCRSCHQKIEYDRNGNKRTTKQAQSAFRRLWGKLPEYIRQRFIRRARRAK